MFKRGLKPRVEPKKPVANVLDINEIAGLSEQITDPEARCLFNIIYLSGARVSEAIQLRKRDVKLLDSGELIINLLTLKNQDHPQREIPVLYKESKHIFYHSFEKPMVDDILKYINSLSSDTLIFSMTRQKAFNKFTRVCKTIVSARLGKEVFDGIEKKINPHFLRHCRLTHMVTEYGLREFALQQYAGWSSVLPAKHYIQVSYRNLADDMKR